MAKPDIRVATFAGHGAKPVIETVPWPAVPKNAALIKIGACGVCGTDQHILKGHWPKPLPWPFTLGHEIGGVIVEKGPEFTEDFMGKPLEVGSKVMIPPLMPCGSCYYCVHYPETANKCLTPVYYGRYLGFAKPPHLWGGWSEMVYVDLDALHDALRAGQIAAAGLDVLPQEPANPEHPLIEAWIDREPWLDGRLTLSPHAAFYSPDGVRDMRTFGFETIMRAITTGDLNNCVNREFLKQ